MPSAERPLSPHLQIYRPQLTSVLSIVHRLTGVGLALGLVALGSWLVAAALGPGPFSAIQAIAGSWMGQLMLLIWAYALFYHLCNGIRHLCWDAGWGFSLRAVYASGWTVVVVALVLTAATWMTGRHGGFGAR